MLESELGKKTPLKKTEFLTGGPAGLLNYRCQAIGSGQCVGPFWVRLQLAWGFRLLRFD